MDLKFIEDLLKAVRSLDIMKEPTLKERGGFEEKIGVIKNEETKKLFVYYSLVLEKKINFLKRKLFDLINSGDEFMTRISEVDKLVKEIDTLIDKQVLVYMLFKKALEQEIGPQDSIFVRVAKDWEVVKPTKINYKVSGSTVELDQLFTQSFHTGRKGNPNWN